MCACVCVCECVRACTHSAVGVDDPVPLQVVQQDEGLAALRAAVGPLAAVRALVHAQAALLREALAALAAAVRLLARVRAVVDVEVRRALEALAAHAAPEGPPPLVALLVQLELVQAGEGLAAQRADVAPRRPRHRRPPARRRAHPVVVPGGGGGAGGAVVVVVVVVVEAVGREGRTVGGGGVPFRVFVGRLGLPGVSWGERGVVVGSVLRRAVCVGGAPGRLEGGGLGRRHVLLVPTAVGGFAGGLGGRRGDACTGLAVAAGEGVRVRLVGERVGVLLHDAGEIQEAGVDVVSLDDGRPQLVLSVVQREVTGELILFAGAVLASVPTRRRVTLLLLHFDGQLQVVCLLSPQSGIE